MRSPTTCARATRTASAVRAACVAVMIGAVLLPTGGCVGLAGMSATPVLVDGEWGSRTAHLAARAEVHRSRQAKRETIGLRIAVRNTGPTWLVVPSDLTGFSVAIERLAAADVIAALGLQPRDPDTPLVALSPGEERWLDGRVLIGPDQLPPMWTEGRIRIGLRRPGPPASGEHGVWSGSLRSGWIDLTG